LFTSIVPFVVTRTMEPALPAVVATPARAEVVASEVEPSAATWLTEKTPTVPTATVVCSRR